MRLALFSCFESPAIGPLVELVDKAEARLDTGCRCESFSVELFRR